MRYPLLGAVVGTALLTGCSASPVVPDGSSVRSAAVPTGVVQLNVEPAAQVAAGRRTVTRTRTVTKTVARRTVTRTVTRTATRTVTQGSAGRAVPSGSITKDGVFKVGSEVRAGTYRTSGGRFCYWARLANLRGETGSIVDNGFLEGQGYVEILPSDAYFKTSDCGTWTRTTPEASTAAPSVTTTTTEPTGRTTAATSPTASPTTSESPSAGDVATTGRATT